MIHAAECDSSLLVNDPFQEQINPMCDSKYYLKKLSQKKSQFFSKISTIFPSQNGIPIKYSAFWDLTEPTEFAGHSNIDNA